MIDVCYCTLGCFMIGVGTGVDGEVILIAFVGGLDTIGGVNGATIAVLNIVVNWWRASSWVGVVVKGDFGVGACRARVIAMVASVAASTDNMVGIVMLWGKIQLFLRFIPSLFW